MEDNVVEFSVFQFINFWFHKDWRSIFWVKFTRITHNLGKYWKPWKQFPHIFCEFRKKRWICFFCILFLKQLLFPTFVYYFSPHILVRRFEFRLFNYINFFHRFWLSIRTVWIIRAIDISIFAVIILIWIASYFIFQKSKVTKLLSS